MGGLESGLLQPAVLQGEQAMDNVRKKMAF